MIFLLNVSSLVYRLGTEGSAFVVGQYGVSVAFRKTPHMGSIASAVDQGQIGSIFISKQAATKLPLLEQISTSASYRELVEVLTASVHDV